MREGDGGRDQGRRREEGRRGRERAERGGGRERKRAGGRDVRKGEKQIARRKEGVRKGAKEG